jgi:hypothetical protein
LKLSAISVRKGQTPESEGMRLNYLNLLWLVVPEGESLGAMKDLKAEVETQNAAYSDQPPT